MRGQREALCNGVQIVRRRKYCSAYQCSCW